MFDKIRPLPPFYDLINLNLKRECENESHFTGAPVIIKSQTLTRNFLAISAQILMKCRGTEGL